jgi:hypothetical protein
MLYSNEGIGGDIQNGKNHHHFSYTGNVVQNYLPKSHDFLSNQHGIVITIDGHQNLYQVIPVEQKEKHKQGNKD